MGYSAVLPMRQIFAHEGLTLEVWHLRVQLQVRLQLHMLRAGERADFAIRCLATLAG